MKILVLTTIYKDIDDPIDAATTPVVHNFAKIWAADGNEVILIHNFNIFPKCLYFVPQKVWDFFSAKKGFRTILSLSQTKDIDYVRDCVKVYRSTIKKNIPLGSYPKTQLEKSVEKIHRILLKNEFEPDLIVAHMENPQLFQLIGLKSYFPNAKTSLVFHEIDYLHKPKYKMWKENYLPQVDKIGFRSLAAYREACSLIGFDRTDYFMCPSGISDEFVHTIPNFEEKFVNGKINILYVGTFIPRKKIDSIIHAVNCIRKTTDLDISLRLIGGGVLESELKELVNDLELQDVVEFCGRKSHNEVLEEMRNSDVFVMVSEREVFGLVYTEAMSQGCIVVASTEGGMEGIITDGVNGYLSPAGQVVPLTKKLQNILAQGREKNILVAKASYETAKKYTEKNVAEHYLASVMDN